MFASFTLLFLFLATIVPAKLSMFFLCSVFVTGMLVEHETGYAFLIFVAVSLLSLLIVTTVHSLAYIIFFGHYGIGKYYIEKIKDKVTAFILKLLYFNAAMALIYFLAPLVIGNALLSIPLWILIPAAQIVFIIYDYLYSLVSQFYYQKIRKWLMRPVRQ